MTRLVVFAVGIALMGLAACSSHETKTTAETVPAVVKGANQAYLDRAQQQISDLQNRLDSMKPAGKKFTGSHAKNLRTFLNQEYLKLGEAKATLGELKSATPEQLSNLESKLDNTLGSIRSDLNTQAAE